MKNLIKTILILSLFFMAGTAFAAQGFLDCGHEKANTISLSYSYTDGSSVSIFESGKRIVTLGSGDANDSWQHANLTPGTYYNYDLRNGQYSYSPLLYSRVCKTQHLLGATLKCGESTEDRITIDVSYYGANGMSLFRGSNRLITWGSTSLSTHHYDFNVQPGTSYTYYLRNGSYSYSPLILSTTCSTKSPAKASGNISCSVSGSNVTLSYSYSNASYPAIYRNSILFKYLDSQTSGSVTNSSLQPGNYTFYLRDGSTVLDSCTAKVESPESTGTITCGQATEGVDVSYNFYMAENSVGIYRGSVLLNNVGSGTRAGALADRNAPAGTHTYYLRDGQKVLSQVSCTSATVQSSGSIYCGMSTENSISLNYNLKDGQSVSIVRGSQTVSSIGSGTRSGSYNDTSLSSGTSYTYYLRDGYRTLDNVTCSTQDKRSASATISCSPSGDALNLSYSVRDADDAMLYRGSSTQIHYIGSGTKTGSHLDRNVTPGTSNTYYIRNGSTSSSPVLAQTTCTLASQVSGSLYCGTQDENRITLNYNFTNGDSVSLFRGSTRISTIGSGSQNSSYTDTGLTSGNSYTYYLRNGYYSYSPLINQATCSTTQRQQQQATGSLYCGTQDENRITLNYSFTNGDSVALFRGSTRISTIGSGSRSGAYTDTNLTSGNSYTYYLRNGQYSYSPVINQATCQTSAQSQPIGTLYCGTQDNNRISLNYSFSNGDNVSLFRGTTRLSVLGSGSKTSTYADSNLQSGTSYTYYLRNGYYSYSPVINQATCSTGQQQQQQASGSIHCDTPEENAINVIYQFTNGENVYLFRGNSPFTGLGSGSKNGNYRDTNLQPQQSYTYSLRNGQYTYSPLISQTTCQTSSPQQATGSLYCGTQDENRITLNYNFTNGDSVSLFRGSTRISTIGSGSQNSSYTDTGLTSGNSYTYYLRNGYYSYSPIINQATCSTGQQQQATGSLYCGTQDENRITLNYSFTNGDSVSLFRGSTRISTIGSGSQNSSYTDTGLNQGTSYTYYLRNGQYSYSPVINQATCSTSQQQQATGSLYCGTQDENRITLNYSFTNGDSVALFRGSTRISTIGSGSQNSSYTDTGLNEGTSYTYYLRNGYYSYSPLINQATCQTSAPQQVTGSLNCGTVENTAINLNYNFNNGDNVYLFRGSSSLASLGNGFRNGSYRDSNLQSGNSYTYYLRNGQYSYSPLIGQASCSTQSVSDIYITALVRNITRNTDWVNSVVAIPDETLNFSVAVSSPTDASNVTITNLLPSGVNYIGNLRVDGSIVGGNPNSVYLGNLSANKAKVITFDARLSGEESFSIGSTTLRHTATAQNNSFTKSDDSTIIVQRGLVAGIATHINTGFTNNKFLDYLLLPLIAAIIMALIFRRYLLVINRWLERKREGVVEDKASRELQKQARLVREQEQF